MAELVPITSISIPDLVSFYRKDMNDELIEKIKSHPDWNAIWDGELLQNSSYAIINFFTYLLSKVKESNNRLVKENFFVAADDPQSIVNGLLAYGLSLPQNRGAKVELQGIVQLGEYIFKQLVIPAGTQVYGTNLEGDTIPFEIYKTVGDTYKVNYDDAIIIEPATNGTQKTTFSVSAIAGTTNIKEYTLPTYDYEKFTIDLETSEIIEDSIEIVFDLNGAKQTTLIETDNFTNRKTYNNIFTTSNSTGIPMYKIAYSETGNASIVFGTKTFGGYFPTGIVDGTSNVLTIRYRVGGGKNSNINTYGINQNVAFQITTNRGINIIFRNLSNGAGGRDRSSIFEEQFYAPYRFGKDKAIVDERDVAFELSGSLIKHKIDTPKYSEVSNTVNILHYNNYIVPQRNFNNFEFPTPLVSDNATTYNTRFLEAINTFCNVDKIHDGTVVDELVNSFQDTSFDYLLQMKNPLNGSVVIRSYDFNNNENDRLTFPTNYTGAVNNSGGFTVKAVAKSRTNLISFTIQNTRNRLKLKIDKGSEAGMGELLNLVLTDKVYGNIAEMALEIDTKIKASGNQYISSFPDFIFCYGENGFLVISSPSTGETSRVELIEDTSDSVLSTLNLTKGVYVPTVGTGYVFKDTSNFNATESEINIVINTDSFPSNYTTTTGAPEEWPNNSSALGPIVTFVLTDEFGKRFVPQIGSTITCVLTDTSSGTPVERETITFSLITDSVTNGAVTGDYYLTSQANSILTFDYTTSTISIRLADNTGNGIVPLDITTVLGSTEATVRMPSLDVIYEGMKISDPDLNPNFLTTTVQSIIKTNMQLTLAGQTAFTNRVNAPFKVFSSPYCYTKIDENTVQVTPQMISIPYGAAISNIDYLTFNTKLESWNSTSKQITLNQPAAATGYGKDFLVTYNYPILSMTAGSSVLTTNQTIDKLKIEMIIEDFGAIESIDTERREFVTRFGHSNTEPQKNIRKQVSTGMIYGELTASSAEVKIYGTENQNKIFAEQTLIFARATLTSPTDLFSTNTTVVSRNLGIVTMSNPTLTTISTTTQSGLRITTNFSSNEVSFLNNLNNEVAHGLETGNKIVFKTQNIDTIVKDVEYFVRKVDANTITLHTSFENATKAVPVVFEIAANVTVSTQTIQKTTGNVALINFAFDAVFDIPYNPSTLNNIVVLSDTSSFFEGLGLQATQLTTGAYVSSVSDTTITIEGEATVTTKSANITCRVSFIGDTIVGQRFLTVDPARYLQTGMLVEDGLYDPDTVITNIVGSTVYLSSNSPVTKIFEKIEFSETYRATQRKDTSILNMNQFSKLRVGMSLLSNTAFTDSVSILNINPDTKVLRLSDTAQTSVTEEAETSSYYDYDTFTNSIYSAGSITFSNSFDAQTYKYITTDYKPNPYRNEGEAAGFLDVLKDTGKKMIGIEPLLKKVNFIPIPISALLSARPGVSKNGLLELTKAIIERYFGFNNDSYFSDIGIGFATDRLRSILNNETINTGIDVATINSPSEKILDGTGIAYYFVFPEYFLSRIITLEQNYPQISGFSSLYDVNIKVE